MGCLRRVWSTAGVIGPLVVNVGRDYLVKTEGRADAAAYSTVVYVLGGLPVTEFLLNLFVKAPGNSVSSAIAPVTGMFSPQTSSK